MSRKERCDEIIRLIYEVLAEVCEFVAGGTPLALQPARVEVGRIGGRPGPGRQVDATWTRRAQSTRAA